jgi:GT2 family glycosyltransferase
MTRQVPVAIRRVSVGIVNHNGEPYLMQTLRAVARLGPAVDDVLLIDSGSTDGGGALVREHFPHVRVIELGANLGPAAARNRAIREGAHDRILLIDNDVEPLPGSVHALATALDPHPKAILAMATVLYEQSPATVQYVGAEPHFLGTQTLLHADTPVAQLEDRVRAVGTAITCCVMVDRVRYGDRRWFDERLFFYLEDHEFGLRATLQGYDCLIVPEARCLHRAGTIGVSIRETGRFTPGSRRPWSRSRCCSCSARSGKVGSAIGSGRLNQRFGCCRTCGACAGPCGGAGNAGTSRS